MAVCGDSFDSDSIYVQTNLAGALSKAEKPDLAEPAGYDGEIVPPLAVRTNFGCCLALNSAEKHHKLSDQDSHSRAMDTHPY